MQTFFRHCIGCGTHRGLTPGSAGCALCVACADELAELGRPRLLTLEGFPCLALAEYSGLFRRLILRSKVKGDHAALAFLERWAKEAFHSARAPWARGAGAVMACPSSFWGRLRGRLDLAANAAAALAEAQALPLVPAPYHLFWRLSKRALAEGPAERAAIRAALPQGARDRLAARWGATTGQKLGHDRVLVLDDVATTGRTLVETAKAVAALAPGSTPTLVAIAAAPRLHG